MKISRRKFVRNVAGASAAIGTIGVAGCAGKEKNQEVAEVGEVMQPKGPAKEKYDAIVVGAGLSGLNAAVLLEEAGY
ncbi:MAG: hypothetical protein AAFP96_03980, partial [Bacteroidota bacterium]